MFKKDYIKIADMFRRESYGELFSYLIKRFKEDNPLFDEVKFREAVLNSPEKPSLETKFQEAHDRGIEILNELVINTLKRNKNLTKFVMGMGVFSFVDKDNNNVSWEYMIDRPSFQKLDDFMIEWDSVFKFSGEYTEIDSSGKITH